jgi:hypothetical protein
MGYDPFAAEAPRTARLRLSSNEAGFSGVLQIVEPDGTVSGQRELSDPDCSEVSRALATAASVAIDPLSIGQPEVPRADSTPVAAPPPTATGRPIEEPSSQGRAPGEEDSTYEVWLGAGVSAGLGIAPGPVVGLGLGGDLQTGRILVGARFRYDTPPGTARSDTGDQLSINLLGLELSGCLNTTGPLAVCLVGWGGSYQTEAPRLPNPRTVTSFFAQVGGRVRLSWLLSDWGRMWASLDVLGSMTRVSHVIDDETVWTAAPLTGFLGTGLEVRAL